MIPKTVRKYLSDIGKKGGATSRRALTTEQARAMCVIRDQKRLASKATPVQPPRPEATDRPT